MSLSPSVLYCTCPWG